MHRGQCGYPVSQPANYCCSCGAPCYHTRPAASIASARFRNARVLRGARRRALGLEFVRGCATGAVPEQHATCLIGS
jgi:hypothetical protein